MKRLRGEEGIAMITAVIFLFVMLAMGAALMVTAGSQQRSSLNQQSGETAYSLAEAALNAQVFALSQGWPTTADASSTTAPNYGYPASCNAASNGTSYCPTAGDLSAYPSGGTCPAGTQGDAWSSSSTVTNGWTTYVRDAGSSSQSSWSLFTDSAEQNAARFDASSNGSGSGALWIRSVGIVNCHIAVLVTKVAEQVVPMSFPSYVLNANSFSTGNNGQNSKDIVNTEDTSGNSSDISLRCAGSTYGNGAQPPNTSCDGASSGQVQPGPVWASPPAGTPTLSGSQLTELQKLAQANGTYYPAGDCNFSNPSAKGASQGGLAGSPVYITGPCNNIGPISAVTINGPVVNNACSTYGFIVLANGSMTIGGNSTFCGVIYAPNLGSVSGNVVTLQGGATVIGGLNVDGNAALSLGDSGNGVINCTDTGRQQKCGDLEFSLAAFENLDGFAGVDASPNSFRQLPDNQ